MTNQSASESGGSNEAIQIYQNQMNWPSVENMHRNDQFLPYAD